MSGKESPILVVSGMSGAGKSTALRALEDIGFEAVDNLPLPLLPMVAQLHDRIAENIREAASLVSLTTYDGKTDK